MSFLMSGSVISVQSWLKAVASPFAFLIPVGVLLANGAHGDVVIRSGRLSCSFNEGMIDAIAWMAHDPHLQCVSALD